LTTTDMTVGTVAYSAPEQLMGEDIDGRADQYALATTAYRLLTGTSLFPHSNPAVVISRHLKTAPPALVDTRPELLALDPVVAAALAKDANDRFPHCSDFAQALTEQAATARTPAPAAPTTPAPVKRPTASGPGSAEPAAPKPAPHATNSQMRAAVAVAIVAVLPPPPPPTVAAFAIDALMLSPCPDPIRHRWTARSEAYWEFSKEFS
jgi:serine/threonine-protein kinase